MTLTRKPRYTRRVSIFIDSPTAGSEGDHVVRAPELPRRVTLLALLSNVFVHSCTGHLAMARLYANAADAHRACVGLVCACSGWHRGLGEPGRGACLHCVLCMAHSPYLSILISITLCLGVVRCVWVFGSPISCPPNMPLITNAILIIAPNNTTTHIQHR